MKRALLQLLEQASSVVLAVVLDVGLVVGLLVAVARRLRWWRNG